jgi:hypothetical protein
MTRSFWADLFCALIMGESLAACPDTVKIIVDVFVQLYGHDARQEDIISLQQFSMQPPFLAARVTEKNKE